MMKAKERKTTIIKKKRTVRKFSLGFLEYVPLKSAAVQGET